MPRRPYYEPDRCMRPSYIHMRSTTPRMGGSRLHISRSGFQSAYIAIKPSWDGSSHISTLWVPAPQFSLGRRCTMAIGPRMLTGSAGLAGGASQATLKCRNPPIYSMRMRAAHQSLATSHPSAHCGPRTVGTVHYTIASATMPPPESRHAPVISAALHHLCAGRR